MCGIVALTRRDMGVPDLPLIRIPHPLGGITLEQVEGRAHVAIPKVVDLINEQLK